MKLNRRDVIKTALIGIPGLVLLPTALKAEKAKHLCIYSMWVDKRSLRHHRLVMGEETMARWSEPAGAFVVPTAVSEFDVRCFQLTRTLGCGGSDIIHLKNGMVVYNEVGPTKMST